MKAIINGLRYDTEKAILIGNASGGGDSVRDFHHWDAGLYQTPRAKRFFLAGEGGPLTQYGHGTLGQGGRWGGSKIVPLDIEEAREWAEQYLTTDEVEKGFAAEIQDA